MAYTSGVLNWDPSYLSSVRPKPILRLRIFDGTVAIPGRSEWVVPHDAKQVRQKEFELTRLPALGWCWTIPGKARSTLSHDAVAEVCVTEYVEALVGISQRRRG
jgi:hypothetical protein